MKKVSIISLIAGVMIVAACSDIKREPGRVYMPDMAYSRAYETYASTANLDSLGIHYDKAPVPGTIKRSDVMPFTIAKDATGDSANYIASKAVPSPLVSLSKEQAVEAERLYLVNCGICHGTKLDGNGPLYNGGNGPYAAAPRNLASDPYSLNMPEGQMFYSVTYGKGQMGPYASQLNTKQRWMVVKYIKMKQGKANPTATSGEGGAPAPSGGNNTPAADSTATKK